MELPKRKQNRLSGYDYSTPNAYFITICTEERKNLFWREIDSYIAQPDNIPLSKIGFIAQQVFQDIPNHYPAITVDHSVIMPNHIHLLLQINTDNNGMRTAAPTISTIINQAKGLVAKKVGFPIWQKGFYDHIIRSEQDYLDVCTYIEGNPGKWSEDKLYFPENS